MKRLLCLLGGLGLLLLPATALAADGFFVANSGYNDGDFSGGVYFLCDGSDWSTSDDDFGSLNITENADRTCGQNMTTAGLFDLRNELAGGLPSIMIFHIHATDSCSAAYSIDINSTTLTTGAAVHDLVVLDSTTTSAVVTWPASATNRFLQVTTSTTTNCAPLDITVDLRFKK